MRALETPRVRARLESSPQFAKYAKGELAHDEELRTAYASAGVHLHVFLLALELHQRRVLERFLSGGVALSRLMHETVRPLRQRVLLGAARSEAPHIPSPCGTVRGVAVADHPELMRWTSTMQRLGLIEPGIAASRSTASCTCTPRMPPTNPRRATRQTCSATWPKPRSRHETPWVN